MSARRLGIWLGMGALLVGAAQACSASSTNDEDDGKGGSGASTSGPAGPGGFSGSGGGATVGTGVGGGDDCAETSSEAESDVLPADIIIAVDNSGSMSAEAGYVQGSMVDFVNAIVGSGIDAHVVLISADSSGSNGICVPAPVGSGSCPNDENLPSYRHVVQTVGSTNALQLILDTYPQWQSSLRAQATKTIAVVSDDDSALNAASFTNQLLALDPSFQGFKFDAIVAPYNLSPFACFNCSPPNCAACDPCCGADSGFCMPLPADEGKVYKQLVSQTMGVIGNLCLQNFLPVFLDMATAVVSGSQVACVYDIPTPSMGEIDYGKVNVAFKPNPNAPEQPIYYVPGGAADCDAAGGWYYDDPNDPSQILLCPATCNAVQLGEGGAITVKFGCQTIVK
jgi:hypothetical protein